MDIAASGIAFIQVGVGTGKAILKAIQLWEQVKQLPDDLKARIKRLRSLEPILRQIEADFAKRPDLRVHPTAQQSVTYAREAEATLRSHIEKLEDKIHGPKSNFRRRVNSFKIITLKKEELSMLESELAWAMESVQLAITCFHMAQRAKSELSERSIIDETSARIREYTMACQDDMVKKTAQAVANMFKTEELSLMGLKPAEFDTGKQTKENEQIRKTNGFIAWPSSFEATVFGRYSFRHSKSNKGWTASVQMPWSQCVRELRWTGWQYCFHTYNIRPMSSPAFKAAERGDLTGLMKLFKTGQATPFDRNEKGRSLLYLAAKKNRLEVCQVLIQQGVPADDERELHGHNPIDAIVTSRNNFTSPTAPDATHQALISLFRTAAHAASTLTLERLFAYIAEYSAGDDFVRVYQTQFLHDYHGLPLRDRAEAVRLASFVAHDPRTYRSLLSADMEITRGDVQESVREGFSLLHSAAIAVGKRMADELQYDPRTFRARSYTEYWSDLIVDTVRAAPEIKSLCHVETVVPWGWFLVPVWKSTPLISLLGGALCRLSPEIRLPEWDSIFQAVLKQWLRDLQAAGVDLLQYGRQEALVHKFTCPEVRGAFDSDAINASRRVVRNDLQEASKDSWMMSVDWTFDKSDRYWSPIRIIALYYGPEVEDWRVLWLVESEAFAGEFWRVVEAPRVTMPGSWVD